MRFKDKSVIITGGGGKIAKAYALAFAKEGARVALPDVVSADSVVKAIKDMGGTAMSTTCDISDEKSVKAMSDQVAQQFGSVDIILINNAAYFMNVWKGSFWEMEVGEFDKAMAVNVRGSWLCAKAVVPYMQKQNKGKIVNIFVQRRVDRQSELRSLRYLQGSPHRDDSGHGSGAGRLECLRQHGDAWIRGNRGTTSRSRVRKNPRQPRSLRRTQVANDLVGTVLFLSSTESDFTTGQLLNVDGGFHFVG